MSHPYKKSPHYARWSKSVAGVARTELDPVVSFPFRLTPSERIATAGSCFAQHIARHLARSGFNYYIAEPGHSAIPPAVRERHTYGVFSARYGNIYTARQLLQLLLRATRKFAPVEDVWEAPDGSYVDPYRPAVQPGNFRNIEELRADRQVHLRAVRRMLKKMDVFIFTLGLTEAWRSKVDGAVFPLCPGVAGGEFDAAKHEFVNFSVKEVASDMKESIKLIRRFRENAKIILTVSPVPLAATALNRHVLVSTTYSKSVLRVAAEMIAMRIPGVAYFPSYEIITGAHSRGRYFAGDLRSVTDEGVAHVMRVFFRHATEGGVAAAARPAVGEDDFSSAIEKVTETLCEEAFLDRSE